MTMSVLLDSSFLIALNNTREKDHGRAIELAIELENDAFGERIVSDYIFDETVTILKKYLGNEQATEKGSQMLNSIRLVKVDVEVFSRAWELSKQYDELSFTDCSNVALMRHYAIGYLATFDGGFRGIVNVLG